MLMMKTNHAHSEFMKILKLSEASVYKNNSKCVHAINFSEIMVIAM